MGPPIPSDCGERRGHLRPVEAIPDASVPIGSPPPEDIEAATNIVSLTELRSGALVVDDADGRARRGARAPVVETTSDPPGVPVVVGQLGGKVLDRGEPRPARGTRKGAAQGAGGLRTAGGPPCRRGARAERGAQGAR